MYLLASFIMQNFQKIDWIQSYDDVPFSGQNGLFGTSEDFFGKSINISSMYLLAPFFVQNFKKSLELLLSYKDASFSGSFAPNGNYFRKTVNIITV